MKNICIYYSKIPFGCTFYFKKLYSSLKHFNKTRHMFRLFTEPSSGVFLSLKLHIFKNVHSLVHFINTVFITFASSASSWCF